MSRRRKISFLNVCHLSHFETEVCSVQSDALYCAEQVDSLCLRCLETLRSFHCYLHLCSFSKSVFFHPRSLRVIPTNCRIVHVIRVFFLWAVLLWGLNWVSHRGSREFGSRSFIKCVDAVWVL